MSQTLRHGSEVATSARSNPQRASLKTVLGLLGASVGAVGCGSTTNVVNNYYVPQDASSRETSVVESDVHSIVDSAVPTDASVCRISGSPLMCGSPTVRGQINQGEQLIAGNIAFNLEDVETRGSQNNAIVALLNSDCQVVMRFRLPEGQTREVSVGGANISVTATEVVAGYTFGSKYANLEVNGICPTDAGASGADAACSIRGSLLLTCGASVTALINTGESINVSLVPGGVLSVRLDDLEAHGDVVSAIFSMYDGDCNILRRDRVPSEETRTTTFHGESVSVTANRLAPGYSGGARWADLTVTHECADAGARDAGTSD